LPVRLAEVDGINASDWKSKLRFQIEMEGQAVQDSDFLTDERMPTAIAPVSPVSMARLWSPFPLAVHLLGRPISSGIHESTCFGLWPKGKRDIEIEKRESDVSFFQTLLRGVLHHPSDHDGVALVVSIGWSYDNDSKFDGFQKRIMKRLGFIETRRHLKNEKRA